MRMINGGLAALCLLCLNAIAIADEPPADPDDGWASLIPEEGDALTGWAVGNDQRADQWKLEDGVIIGDNPDRQGSVLWTQSQYTDFELIVEYRTPSQDYDSGVFLRGESHQVQIGISRSLKKDLTGCLYCPADGNGSYPIQPDEKVKEHHKLGEWNTLRIVVKGKHIQTYLNGELINDYEGKTIPDRGKLGLQLHAGVHQTMAFRVVRVRGLTDEE